MENEKKEKIILQLRDVSLSIRSEKRGVPEKKILQDISFDLVRGQHLGIVGDSGAGKSMTMYAVADLLPSSVRNLTGSIAFSDGANIIGMDARKRREICTKNVAIILQDSINSLNPYRKVYDQLAENYLHFHPGASRSEVMQSITEGIRAVGIDSGAENLSGFPRQFSGGERQRLAIYMALQTGAEILLADEPTTALDAIHQKILLDLICDICEKHQKTLIFISHNLALVSRVCDSCIVMDQGRIIERGTCREVFGNPQHPQTRSLTAGTRELLHAGRQEGNNTERG